LFRRNTMAWVQVVFDLLVLLLEGLAGRHDGYFP